MHALSKVVYASLMEGRRSDYDVTNSVRVTDPDSVCKEVCRLSAELYPNYSMRTVELAFRKATDLFYGNYPGYHPCDTPYHDLLHTLDVTLTMARLLYGYDVSVSRDARLGAELFRLGVVVALFHDSGYIRRLGDHRHRNGAAYTSKHVTRGGRFLTTLLPELGMGEQVTVARKLVHFTGYEVSVPKIQLQDHNHRILGKLLGSADLMSQMSDRCYLEKCRDRLYPEFVVAGVAGEGGEEILYPSPEALIFQTPDFFSHVTHERLGQVLGGVHSYARHFSLPQRDFYLEAFERNRDYLLHVVKQRDIMLLRRQPPWTLVVDKEQILV